MQHSSNQSENIYIKHIILSHTYVTNNIVDIVLGVPRKVTYLQPALVLSMQSSVQQGSVFTRPTSHCSREFKLPSPHHPSPGFSTKEMRVNCLK